MNRQRGGKEGGREGGMLLWKNECSLMFVPAPAYMYTLVLSIRCNRWSAQAKADKVVKEMQSTLERDYVKRAYRDLEHQQRKFEFYHERYNNHLQSLDVREGGREGMDGWMDGWMGGGGGGGG